MFTSYGKQQAAIRLGSNSPFISYIAIGSGSGTAIAGDLVLRAEWDRNAITGSPDYTVNQKIGFTADWNSVEISGLKLTEFGLIASGTALTGSIWQREAFASITFDGTNELRCITTLECI